MIHQTDTPTQFTAVSGHTHLFRRDGGTYYLRVKVPREIRPFVKKTEIRISLKTKKLKEAVPAVNVEWLRVSRLFAEAEARRAGEKPRVSPISSEELRWMVQRSFVDLQTQSQFVDGKPVDALDVLDRQMIAETKTDDLMVLLGAREFTDEESQGFVKSLVDEQANRWGILEGTENYDRAFPLFRAAVVENFKRSVARMKGHAPRRSDFPELSETSIVPPRPPSAMTVGALLDEFMDYQRSHHAETTPAAYVMSERVLREELGETTPLVQVTKPDMERVFEFLTQVPVNAKQRYGNLSLRKAIEAANKKGDTRRLAPRSVRNYLIHFAAIFNFAKQEGYITESPVHSRKLQLAKKKLPRSPQRKLFTDQELAKLFSAPLFTGCVDDERGYMTPSTNKPRRGRFWIPLLGLLHGFRCNEACQIYASDVGVETGIPFIRISEFDEDGRRTEKRLKNQGSERKIPIHPELLKIGFMEFVEARSKDTNSPRLFPELRLHPTKARYSHFFSPWFSQFVRRVCGESTRATFHSLRHHFRTALMNAGVSTELAEALGGWTSDGSSEREYRHSQLPQLRIAIEKVVYPVEFTALYTAKPDQE